MSQSQDLKHLASIKEKSIGLARQESKVEQMRLDHLAEKHILEKGHTSLLALINASADEIDQLELEFPDLPDEDEDEPN